MQILGQIVVLAGIQLLPGDLDQIGAQAVLVAVGVVFLALDVLEAGGGVVMEQAAGFLQSVAHADGHVVDRQTALLQSQRRVRDEALLQTDQELLGGIGLVLDQGGHDGLQHVDEGHEQDDHEQTEDRIDQGDRERVHHLCHEREIKDDVRQIKDCRADQGTCQSGDQVDQGGPLAVGVCAERGEQNREGRTDGDAHEQGQGRFKGHCAGHGEGLDDTDRRRGRLQDRREDRADQDTEQRVGHRGEHVPEPSLLAQLGDRAAHILHADHQNGEAHHDIADVVVQRLLGEHAQKDTDDGDDARQRRRREDVSDAGARFQITQADDPARDGGAEDRADRNADRLAKLHHGRVHKTDHHDAGGRR